VNLVLKKWAQMFSPRDLWSVVFQMTLLVLGCLAVFSVASPRGFGLIGQRHTLTKRANRQQSKRICLAGTGHAYAPHAYGQLTAAHSDALAYAARIRAVRLESCDSTL
jgi:hypothetical protein